MRGEFHRFAFGRGIITQSTFSSICSMTVSDEYKGIEGMSSAQRTYARLLRGPCATHTVLHSLRFRARTQENIGNPIPITLDTTIQNTNYTKITSAGPELFTG